jgi:hypothetical protein
MSTRTLPIRKIGGTDVTAIGYGAMGLGGAFYGAAPSDDERLAVRFLSSLNWLQHLNVVFSVIVPRCSV